MSLCVVLGEGVIFDAGDEEEVIDEGEEGSAVVVPSYGVVTDN